MLDTTVTAAITRLTAAGVAEHRLLRLR